MAWSCVYGPKLGPHWHEEMEKKISNILIDFEKPESNNKELGYKEESRLISEFDDDDELQPIYAPIEDEM